MVWVFTVSSLRPSSRAATDGRVAVGEQLQDLALAAGQLAAAAFRRHGRVDELLLLERRPDRPGHLLGAGGARDVGAGAGLQGGEAIWRSGRSPWATIPMPGAVLRSARIASCRVSARLARGLAAQIDDRDVDAADVANQVDASPRLSLSWTSKSPPSVSRTPSRTSGWGSITRHCGRR